MKEWTSSCLTQGTEPGFSLIELLLSISLSFVLIHLLIHSYIFLEKRERFLNEKIKLEENAQFAQFILTHEIQTAGYIGCNRWNLLHIKYHTKKSYLPMNPIQLIAKKDAILGNGIHPESDILIIEKMSEKTIPLSYLKSKTTQSSNEKFYFGIKNLDEYFKKNDLLVISDCEKADFIMPTTISHPHSAAFKALHYAENAQIGKFTATAYFIEKTRRKNLLGEPIYALYAYDLVNHKKMEYIAGIKQMKFSYAWLDKDENNVIFKPFTDSNINNLSENSGFSLLKISLQLVPENSGMHAFKIAPKDVDVLVYLRNCHASEG